MCQIDAVLQVQSRIDDLTQVWRLTLSDWGILERAYGSWILITGWWWLYVLLGLLDEIIIKVGIVGIALFPIVKYGNICRRVHTKTLDQSAVIGPRLCHKQDWMSQAACPYAPIKLVKSTVVREAITEGDSTPPDFVVFFFWRILLYGLSIVIFGQFLCSLSSLSRKILHHIRVGLVISSGVIEHSVVERAGSTTKRFPPGLCTRSRQVFNRSIISLLHEIFIAIPWSDHTDLDFRLFSHLWLLRPQFVLLGWFAASIKRASSHFWNILKICHVSLHMEDLVSLHYRRHFWSSVTVCRLFMTELSRHKGFFRMFF